MAGVISKLSVMNAPYSQGLGLGRATEPKSQIQAQVTAVARVPGAQAGKLHPPKTTWH